MPIAQQTDQLSTRDKHVKLPYPFLRDEFLDALETSRSVGKSSGWSPIHIHLEDQAGGGFMPLYLKTHSMGEYVFDYVWANAYHHHGFNYYPKLLSAIPFTPSSGPRTRHQKSLTGQQSKLFLEKVYEKSDIYNASSWHLLFPDDSSVDAFAGLNLLHRFGVQYHWFNYGFKTFDDFLAKCNSRKRKMIRRERSQIKAQNIETETLFGQDITPEIWNFFYHLYQLTYAKRNGSNGYLTSKFFEQIGNSMPGQIAMAVARIDHKPIACALYFYDSTTLYGRYWGSIREFNYLHFELCYYSGIELSIAMGLQRFDAGAQGEHKIIRGFEPRKTHSLHWIKHPDFRDAIKHFLREEAVAIDHHIKEANKLLPFRQT